MRGLIPYVDFTDSKGPLLWLIYGIGYLISNRDYFGVLIITCIWYAAIGYYIFKLSFLYLQDIKKSLICVVIMPFFIFNKWFHDEIRAEDFCLLFILLSLYSIASIQEVVALDERKVRNAFTVLGVSFASLLLIKFNYAVMQGIMLIYPTYLVGKKEQKYLKLLLTWFLAGVAIICLPFILLFLIQGNLQAFMMEYFFKTLSTVSYGSPVTSYIADWIYLLLSPSRLSMFMGVLVFCWLFGQQFSKTSWFPIYGFMVFFSLTIYHAFLQHYFICCSFFIIFGVIYVVSKVGNVNRLQLAGVSCSTFILVSGINLMSNTSMAWNESLSWVQSEKKIRFNRIAREISKSNRPYIIFIGMEHGEGVLADALPGCKYYATQNGASKEMLNSQRQSILEGRSDYLYIDHIKKMQDLNLTFKEIESLGYHLVSAEADSTNYLYRR